MSPSLKAQNVISGKVLEKENEGAPFATVTLLNVTDSTIIKGAITGEDGHFQLKSAVPGEYFLAVSSIGFSKYYSDTFSYAGNELVLPTVVLNESVETLDEVTVKAQRQVMVRKADRYVMDVSASTFQSDNLSDIFQALPFVQVKGEEISVNGKGGVLILLDKVQMPGATLNTILSSMTGDEIDKIEFITNPSSRYPASISTVVKITTKRSKNYGLTGSARLTASQGIKAKGLAGTSLTYRKEKWVANLNLNYSAGASLNENEGYRVLNSNGHRLVLTQELNSNFVYQKPSLRGSFEYTIDAKNSIGFQANTSYTKTMDNSLSQNRIQFSNTIGGPADSLLSTDLKDYGYNLVQNYNLFYNHKLDSLGKSFDIILTYTPYQRKENTEMVFQNLLNAQGELIRKLRTVRNINANQANILVGQMDWELPYKNNWNLTTGAKITHSTNHTQPTQEVLANDLFVLEDEFSFQNEFEENIVATYASVDKLIGKKTSVNAGLRVEYATMVVDNITSGKRAVDRSFFDFFPNLMINHTLSDKLQLSANYRRTIQRPGFSVLTPFRTYVDDYTITEGNPGLLPKYTSSYSLNAVFMGNLYFEFEYRDEKDVYTQLPEAVGDVTIWKDRNFDLNSYSLVGNYGYKITPWWSGGVFAYGAIFESAIDTKGFKAIEIPRSFFHTFGIENTFSLPKGLRLETSFNYTAPFKYGLVDVVANNYSRIALKGDLLNKKIQYTLSATDLFRGDITGGSINAFNVETDLTNYYDARRIQLGLVYRFGKTTVKNARSKKMGNEDVLNRVE